MANRGWATDRIMVGHAPVSLFDARKIAAEGVTHVLNLRAGDIKPEDVQAEIPWWNAAGVTYVNNPTHDDGKEKPTSWFKASIDFVFGALASSPKAKVFVHCGTGENRAPSTVYAILQAWGTPAKDAKAHVLDARPGATMDYNKDADRALKALGYRS